LSGTISPARRFWLVFALLVLTTAASLALWLLGGQTPGAFLCTSGSAGCSGYC
jgi:hypothetical protein